MYTVHDCFAVTADKVQLLIESLIAVYIKIYHEKDYLRKFDKRVKEALIKSRNVTYDPVKERMTINEVECYQEVKEDTKRTRKKLLNIDKLIEDNKTFAFNLREAIDLLK